MVVAFKESKSVYDGENKWKLFLRIVFLHLICPPGKSMRRLVQRFIDAAKDDDEGSDLLFIDNKCIVNTNVYSPKQLIRLPFSIKNDVPLEYLDTKHSFDLTKDKKGVEISDPLEC